MEYTSDTESDVYPSTFEEPPPKTQSFTVTFISFVTTEFNMNKLDDSLGVTTLASDTILYIKHFYFRVSTALSYSNTNNSYQYIGIPYMHQWATHS